MPKKVVIIQFVIIPTLQIVAFLPFHSSWRDREASERSLILGLSNLVETFFYFCFSWPVLIPVGALDSRLRCTAAGAPVFLRPPKQYWKPQDITKQLRSWGPWRIRENMAIWSRAWDRLVDSRGDHSKQQPCKIWKQNSNAKWGKDAKLTDYDRLYSDFTASKTWRKIKSRRITGKECFNQPHIPPNSILALFWQLVARKDGLSADQWAWPSCLSDLFKISYAGCSLFLFMKRQIVAQMRSAPFESLFCTQDSDCWFHVQCVPEALMHFLMLWQSWL